MLLSEFDSPPQAVMMEFLAQLLHMDKDSSLRARRAVLAIEAYNEFIRSGKTEHIDEAIELARGSIDVKDGSDLTTISRLNNLGVMLACRYERTGELANLQEAIKTARKAVDLTPADHADLPRWLNNLANTLTNLHRRIGDISALEEAIIVIRKAVDLTPTGHPEWPGRVNNLGNILQRQYRCIGDLATLEQGIIVVREAIDLTPSNHPDQPALLNTLGNALQRRYERIGEISNLEEAIMVARKAVDSTPTNHPSWPGRLSNLGNRLESQYERTGEMVKLEEAIRVARKAVDSTPADSTDWLGILNSLGNKLETRYKRTEEMANLEEAIIVVRRLVDSTPAEHPDRPRFLSSLGNKLASRYESTKETANLEEAIALARRSVDSTPADHPDRAGLLNNLGVVLQRRYEQTGEMSDLEQALNCLHAAWNCQSATPFHRIQAAARCLTHLAVLSMFDQAIDLGQAVLDLLPAVKTNVLGRNDQQFVMSAFAGIAANLCACFLATGQSARALESLERGRAVILGQLVDGRNDLSSLRYDHCDISCQYEQLRDEINQTAGDREQGTWRIQAANRRREATAELDRCIQEIRGLAGYERFLLGQPTAEMQECAKDGTIIVVNITDCRSDAILLSKAAIRTLSLPRLLASDAKAWLNKTWTGQAVRRAERPQKNKEYVKYLLWLWDVCVKLVLDAIDTDLTKDALPRIWWIGTGLGSSMPFHAAGVHAPGSTENAFSKAVSSYTPSIKALGYANRRAGMAKGAKVSLLLTTMPTTPTAALGSDMCNPCDLPGVIIEEKRVVDLVTGNMPVQLLHSPCVAQVLDKMQDCSIAHFACHGSTDHADPSNSGLILQKVDGQERRQDRLTVKQVSELSLAGAYIAYLSACSTAENRAAQLEDEVIHVVSGFQVAGFPHVVGCMWPSIDRICAEVAGRFYKSLFCQRVGSTLCDGRVVACSVREAVMAVREAEMGMPLLWAQFVHFGA